MKQADGWRSATAITGPGPSPPASWPVAVTGGASVPLVWHLDDTLAAEGDGSVQVRAVFTDSGGSSASSAPVTVTLDQNGGSAPQQNIGPGSVNLLTGDISLTADDASVFDAAASRTFSSRAVDTDAAGQAAVFGPGRVSSVTATTGVGYSSLTKTSDTSVSLLNADGSSVAFTFTAGTSWTPEPGAEQLTLTGVLTDAAAGNTFTLKNTTTGTVSTFRRTATSNAQDLWIGPGRDARGVPSRMLL